MYDQLSRLDAAPPAQSEQASQHKAICDCGDSIEPETGAICGNCASETQGNLERIIEAKQASQPQWIPVTELPAEEGMYLGMLRDDNPMGWTWEQPVEVAFGMLLHDRKRFSVFDPWEHTNVDIQDYMTHWMPLPAAPKNAI